VIQSKRDGRALALRIIYNDVRLFFADVMSPLKGLLEGQIGWTSSDYGTFRVLTRWFNVFLLMLIFGGIILDKVGVRITGFGSVFDYGDR